MAGILRVDQANVDYIYAKTTGGSVYIPGHILQVKTTKANYGWGSWGSTSEMDMTWMDVQLTTRGTNSSFFVAAQFNMDDTNSAAFGVGLGVKYSTNAGSTWTAIKAPQLHEIYDSGGTDKYNTSYLNITSDALGIAAGSSVTFRCSARFNNANAQHFGGNGYPPYYAQLHTVMEIGA
jgi:hypothetical protein